jgi:hypothetical protein
MHGFDTVAVRKRHDPSDNVARAGEKMRLFLKDLIITGKEKSGNPKEGSPIFI